MRQILTNKARCKNCGDVIESKHRWDFQVCSCWSREHKTGIAVDGGRDYLKRCFYSPSETFTELSTFGAEL